MNQSELDDDRYETCIALVDTFHTVERTSKRLRALGVSQDLLERAQRRLAREDAEAARREDG